jgi:hypothetical protein
MTPRQLLLGFTPIALLAVCACLFDAGTTAAGAHEDELGRRLPL